MPGARCGCGRPRSWYQHRQGFRREPGRHPAGSRRLIRTVIGPSQAAPQSGGTDDRRSGRGAGERSPGTFVHDVALPDLSS